MKKKHNDFHEAIAFSKLISLYLILYMYTMIHNIMQFSLLGINESLCINFTCSAQYVLII